MIYVALGLVIITEDFVSGFGSQFWSPFFAEPTFEFPFYADWIASVLASASFGKVHLLLLLLPAAGQGRKESRSQ